MTNVTVQESLNVVDQALLNAIAVMENKKELTTTQRESRKAAAITQCKNALMALECKSALSEIEKCEPVAWRMQTHPRGDYIIQKHKPDSARRDLWEALYTSPQPIEKCEPVALADEHIISTISIEMIKELETRSGNKFPYHLWTTKLYTSPISKEWVGLTKEQETEIIEENEGVIPYIIHDVSEKLKQLNTKG